MFQVYTSGLCNVCAIVGLSQRLKYDLFPDCRCSSSHDAASPDLSYICDECEVYALAAWGSVEKQQQQLLSVALVPDDVLFTA
jgi:hypothetical protein